MNEIRNILDKIEPLMEENNENNVMDALSDFTDIVKRTLSKRAERAYRQSGEPWDSRINELEKKYLDSLKITENPNWIQYSYVPYENRFVIAYVAKKPTKDIEVGDVVYPTLAKRQRPNTSRSPITNIFNLNSNIDDILL